MTSSSISRLLALAGEPSTDASPTCVGQLGDLLRRRNGFYAFESALHVYPSGTASVGLERWNAPDLWRSDYPELRDDITFFAEDAFGVQFGLTLDGVATFDPETGELEPLAADLEGWAAAILDDFEFLTGYPLAHEWQTLHGPLTEGTRLVPKVAFVAGGAFEVTNLHACDAVDGMRSRAEVARQIRNVPDGSKIRFAVVD